LTIKDDIGGSKFIKKEKRRVEIENKISLVVISISLDIFEG